jgi:5-(carboxyamino)imidazole ribonucleotide mutase
MSDGDRARVGVIMGSDSDWPVMSAAATALDEFGVPYEVAVVSAHRTPGRMLDYASSAAGRGLRVIIAGAGGAAHLPGMVASATVLPVIGVPVPLAHLDGLDSLLSIVQMPAGVPVGTVSVGGARNAGLLAVRILAASDGTLRDRMAAFQASLERLVLDKDAALRSSLPDSAQSGTRSSGNMQSDYPQPDYPQGGSGE